MQVHEATEGGVVCCMPDGPTIRHPFQNSNLLARSVTKMTLLLLCNKKFGNKSQTGSDGNTGKERGRESGKERKLSKKKMYARPIVAFASLYLQRRTKAMKATKATADCNRKENKNEWTVRKSAQNLSTYSVGWLQFHVVETFSSSPQHFEPKICLPLELTQKT